MKKIILLLVFSSFSTAMMACDICGCGIGNNYIGILPDFTKHILGLRYRYNSLQTHLGEGGVPTYLTTSERYKTIELWSGWNIGKKFRVMASVPYSYNERSSQGINRFKQGIGDVNLSGYYELINTRKPVNSKLLVQSLWAGGSIKLPTGSYNPADKSGSTQSNNLFQLGTASIDYTISAMYDLRLQDIGMNITANYKINTANKYHYTYGNKFGVNAQSYYKFRIRKHIMVAPNAGVQFEQSAKDIDDKISVDVSGGNLLLGTLGVETAYRKIAIGANWQTPLSQNLAMGFVKARDRFMLHISFIL